MKNTREEKWVGESFLRLREKDTMHEGAGDSPEKSALRCRGLTVMVSVEQHRARIRPTPLPVL